MWNKATDAEESFRNKAIWWSAAAVVVVIVGIAAYYRYSASSAAPVKVVENRPPPPAVKADDGGIQHPIPQIFVSEPVYLIAAASGNHVDLCPRVSSILGTVRVGRNLEFLDRVDRGLQYIPVGILVVIIHAVQ